MPAAAFNDVNVYVTVVALYDVSPLNVAEMAVVPDVNTDTSPVELLIVATDGLDDAYVTGSDSGLTNVGPPYVELLR
jgi:hypothetical protein